MGAPAYFNFGLEQLLNSISNGYDASSCKSDLRPSSQLPLLPRFASPKSKKKRKKKGVIEHKQRKLGLKTVIVHLTTESPRYLRFLKCLVHSNHHPLNVSHGTLQLNIIVKNISFPDSIYRFTSSST